MASASTVAGTETIPVAESAITVLITPMLVGLKISLKLLTPACVNPCKTSWNVETFFKSSEVGSGNVFESGNCTGFPFWSRITFMLQLPEIVVPSATCALKLPSSHALVR